MAYVKMADDLQRWWRQKREGHLALQQNCVSCKGSFMIPSAVEDSERAARARHCTDGTHAVNSPANSLNMECTSIS